MDIKITATTISILMFIFLSCTVSAVEVSVNSPQCVDAGDLFNVTIDVTEVDDLSSGVFTLTFDPAVLQVKSVEKGSLMNDGTITPYNLNNNAGTLTVPMGVYPGVDGPGSLVIITFNATGQSGSSSKLELSNVGLGDSSMNVITIDKITGAKVTIGCCDLNNDGIIIKDHNDLMTAYKCFLGMSNNCKWWMTPKNWSLMKKEYQCFIKNNN